MSARPIPTTTARTMLVRLLLVVAAAGALAGCVVAPGYPGYAYYPRYHHPHGDYYYR